MAEAGQGLAHAEQAASPFARRFYHVMAMATGVMVRRGLAVIGWNFVPITVEMAECRSHLSFNADNGFHRMRHGARCQQQREQYRKHRHKTSHERAAITLRLKIKRPRQ